MIKKQNLIGIYSILNIVTNKIYIGSSFDILYRWDAHKYKMKRLECNEKIKNDILLHGIDSFKFEIVEFCEDTISKDDLILKEQYWIDYYNSSYCGYNVKKKAEISTLCNIGGLKCLLYDLDGNFITECNSYHEAFQISGGGSKNISKNILKLGFSKLKRYIVKPYINNYPLKIEKYKLIKSNYQIKKAVDAMQKASIGRIAAVETLNKIRVPILKVDIDGNIIEEYKSLTEAKKTCNKFFEKLNSGILINNKYRFIKKSDYKEKNKFVECHK